LSAGGATNTTKGAQPAKPAKPAKSENTFMFDMNMFDIEDDDGGELAESKRCSNQIKHNEKLDDDDTAIVTMDKPLDDVCVSPSIASPALTTAQPANASPPRTTSPGLLDHEEVVTAEDNDAAVSQDIETSLMKGTDLSQPQTVFPSSPGLSKGGSTGNMLVGDDDDDYDDSQFGGTQFGRPAGFCTQDSAQVNVAVSQAVRKMTSEDAFLFSQGRSGSPRKPTDGKDDDATDTGMVVSHGLLPAGDHELPAQGGSDGLVMCETSVAAIVVPTTEECITHRQLAKDNDSNKDAAKDDALVVLDDASKMNVPCASGGGESSKHTDMAEDDCNDAVIVCDASAALTLPRLVAIAESAQSSAGQEASCGPAAVPAGHMICDTATALIPQDEGPMCDVFQRQNLSCVPIPASGDEAAAAGHCASTEHADAVMQDDVGNALTQAVVLPSTTSRFSQNLPALESLNARTQSLKLSLESRNAEAADLSHNADGLTQTVPQLAPPTSKVSSETLKSPIMNKENVPPPSGFGQQTTQHDADWSIPADADATVAHPSSKITMATNSSSASKHLSKVERELFPSDETSTPKNHLLAQNLQENFYSSPPSGLASSATPTLPISTRLSYAACVAQKESPATPKSQTATPETASFTTPTSINWTRPSFDHAPDSSVFYSAAAFQDPLLTTSPMQSLSIVERHEDPDLVLASNSEKMCKV
jgi:hypothetical protein